MPQPKLWNLETGTLEDVPDFEVRQRIISGDYKWDSTTSNPMPIFSEDRTQIKYLDANIAADKAREYFQAGWDFANEAQLAEFRKEGMVPEEASIWDAMALGGTAGATIIGDVVAGAAFDGVAESIRDARRDWPTAYLLSEIAGGAAMTYATMGSGLLVKAGTKFFSRDMAKNILLGRAPAIATAAKEGKTLDKVLGAGRLAMEATPAAMAARLADASMDGMVRWAGGKTLADKWYTKALKHIKTGVGKGGVIPTAAAFAADSAIWGAGEGLREGLIMEELGIEDYDLLGELVLEGAGWNAVFGSGVGAGMAVALPGLRRLVPAVVGKAGGFWNWLTSTTPMERIWESYLNVGAKVGGYGEAKTQELAELGHLGRTRDMREWLVPPDSQGRGGVRNTNLGKFRSRPIKEVKPGEAPGLDRDELLKITQNLNDYAEGYSKTIEGMFALKGRMDMMDNIGWDYEFVKEHLQNVDIYRGTQLFYDIFSDVDRTLAIHLGQAPYGKSGARKTKSTAYRDELGDIVTHEYADPLQKPALGVALDQRILKELRLKMRNARDQLIGIDGEVANVLRHFIRENDPNFDPNDLESVVNYMKALLDRKSHYQIHKDMIGEDWTDGIAHLEREKAELLAEADRRAQAIDEFGGGSDDGGRYLYKDSEVDGAQPVYEKDGTALLSPVENSFFEMVDTAKRARFPQVDENLNLYLRRQGVVPITAGMESFTGFTKTFKDPNRGKELLALIKGNGAIRRAMGWEKDKGWRQAQDFFTALYTDIGDATWIFDHKVWQPNKKFAGLTMNTLEDYIERGDRYKSIDRWVEFFGRRETKELVKLFKLLAQHKRKDLARILQTELGDEIVGYHGISGPAIIPFRALGETEDVFIAGSRDTVAREVDATTADFARNRVRLSLHLDKGAPRSKYVKAYEEAIADANALGNPDIAAERLQELRMDWLSAFPIATRQPDVSKEQTLKPLGKMFQEKWGIPERRIIEQEQEEFKEAVQAIWEKKQNIQEKASRREDPTLTRHETGQMTRLNKKLRGVTEEIELRGLGVRSDDYPEGVEFFLPKDVRERPMAAPSTAVRKATEDPLEEGIKADWSESEDIFDEILTSRDVYDIEDMLTDAVDKAERARRAIPIEQEYLTKDMVGVEKAYLKARMDARDVETIEGEVESFITALLEQKKLGEKHPIFYSQGYLERMFEKAGGSKNEKARRSVGNHIMGVVVHERYRRKLAKFVEYGLSPDQALEATRVMDQPAYRNSEILGGRQLPEWDRQATVANNVADSVAADPKLVKNVLKGAAPSGFIRAYSKEMGMSWDSLYSRFSPQALYREYLAYKVQFIMKPDSLRIFGEPRTWGPLGKYFAEVEKVPIKRYMASQRMLADAEARHSADIGFHKLTQDLNEGLETGASKSDKAFLKRWDKTLDLLNERLDYFMLRIANKRTYEVGSVIEMYAPRGPWPDMAQIHEEWWRNLMLIREMGDLNAIAELDYLARSEGFKNGFFGKAKLDPSKEGAHWDRYLSPPGTPYAENWVETLRGGARKVAADIRTLENRGVDFSAQTMENNATRLYSIIQKNAEFEGLRWAEVAGVRGVTREILPPKDRKAYIEMKYKSLMPDGGSNWLEEAYESMADNPGLGKKYKLWQTNKRLRQVDGLIDDVRINQGKSEYYAPQHDAVDFEIKTTNEAVERLHKEFNAERVKDPLVFLDTPTLIAMAREIEGSHLPNELSSDVLAKIWMTIERNMTELHDRFKKKEFAQNPAMENLIEEDIVTRLRQTLKNPAFGPSKLKTQFKQQKIDELTARGKARIEEGLPLSRPVPRRDARGDIMTDRDDFMAYIFDDWTTERFALDKGIENLQTKFGQEVTATAKAGPGAERRFVPDQRKMAQYLASTKGNTILPETKMLFGLTDNLKWFAGSMETSHGDIYKDGWNITSKEASKRSRALKKQLREQIRLIEKSSHRTEKAAKEISNKVRVAQKWLTIPEQRKFLHNIAMTAGVGAFVTGNPGIALLMQLFEGILDPRIIIQRLAIVERFADAVYDQVKDFGKEYAKQVKAGWVKEIDIKEPLKGAYHRSNKKKVRERKGTYRFNRAFVPPVGSVMLDDQHQPELVTEETYLTDGDEFNQISAALLELEGNPELIEDIVNAATADLDQVAPTIATNMKAKMTNTVNTAIRLLPRSSDGMFLGDELLPPLHEQKEFLQGMAVVAQPSATVMNGIFRGDLTSRDVAIAEMVAPKMLAYIRAAVLPEVERSPTGDVRNQLAILYAVGAIDSSTMNLLQKMYAPEEKKGAGRPPQPKRMDMPGASDQPSAGFSSRMFG